MTPDSSGGNLVDMQINDENVSARERWLDAANDPATTPMMAQFMTIKADYPDSLLFYRMGDFYELFFEDAVEAAAALDITLTKRGKHGGDDIPMAGVPVHAAEMYLARLIKRSFKVAVCEQVEDPQEAKKRGAKAVVRREVVRLVTPGTITEDSLLDARAQNYLVALGSAQDALSLAVADISTGEFFILPTRPSRLEADLARLNPGELLIPKHIDKAHTLSEALFDWRTIVSPVDDALFDSQRGEKALKTFFEVATLDGFAAFTRADLAASHALLHYLEETQKEATPNLNPPVRLLSDTTMMIDAATRRSLELTVTQGGETAGSLLATIDHTVTGAGARLLATRLSAPITDPDRINERLDAIDYCLRLSGLVEAIRDRLKGTPDMARALSRLTLGRGGPRDLVAVKSALNTAHDLGAVLEESDQTLEEAPPVITAIRHSLGNHHMVADELDHALSDDPPLLLRDGGFIKTGYHAALDDFRTLRDESRQLIAALEGSYREKTGISSLKIKHNNVLGYHVDMPARHAEAMMSAPLNETFIHRQTLANAVRFSTAELSKLAGRISEAKDRALALEQSIFADLVEKIMGHKATLTLAANALAEIDVVASLSFLANHDRYCRPEIDDSLAFEIEDGRHPVVEKSLAQKKADIFISNDCNLNPDTRLWLITGPNMAGKSTFLRQNALIAILAQIGSYVPAKRAHIGVVDRLFSRVGAADDLAHGRSTFMVEMVETAAILNQAGPKSLVILDEIGRGTATYDGLSIAWAAIENLHNINQCRTLFATHYHELTALRETLDAMSLHSMQVREWNGDVIFLHEVAPGAADRSYGIQVAKLAGIPPRVITRARQVLTHLETGDKGDKTGGLINDLPLFQTVPNHLPANAPVPENAILDRLADVNPDQLSPRDALDILYELKELGDAETS